jgi:hypothetical protein
MPASFIIHSLSWQAATGWETVVHSADYPFKRIATAKYGHLFLDPRAFSRTNHCDLPYDALDERFALLASTQGTDSGCSTCLPRGVRLFSLGNREES